jgi:hypothetical protein
VVTAAVAVVDVVVVVVVLPPDPEHGEPVFRIFFAS